ACEFRNKTLAQRCGGDPLQVVAQDHVLHEWMKFGSVREQGWGFFQVGFDFDKACISQASCSRLGIGELQRGMVSGEVFRIGGCGHQLFDACQDSSDVIASAALGYQPSGGLQRAMKIPEEMVVVEYPMERGSAEDAVELTVEW